MRVTVALLAGAGLLGIALGCQHLLTHATVLMDCQFVGMVMDAAGLPHRGYLCARGALLAVPTQQPTTPETGV